jgi:hypothetical protein
MFKRAKRIPLQPLLVAALLAGWLGFAKDASAEANCFCSLACEDNTNYKSGTVRGWLWDSGSLATYTGWDQQGDANQTACNTLCGQQCLQTWNKANAGPHACSKGCANGQAIACWSKVGTREWKWAQGIGTLTNTPAQSTTTYTCPAGTKGDNWVDGGTIAAGKKCTFVACDHYQTFPPNTYPPNGTPIGSWGYTWGEFIGQNVNPAASTVQTAPAVCEIP